MTLRQRFLDPELIRRLGRIELRARSLVEGFWTGLHNSPYRGFSVEFAEHRSYSPGDDPRHIDWKVYGKRERYYIKQYYEETNFVATLLLDGSCSMTYGNKRQNKLEYACLLCAALSYLVLRQHDAVSLGVYDTASVSYLPPRTQLGFLAMLSESLARIEPRGSTDSAGALEQFAATISRKGIVIVVSDFLDDPDRILRGLMNLRFRGHEVIALHLLHPHELDLPFQGNIRFDGLESDLRLMAEPHRLREAYLRALDDHARRLRQGCSRAAIDYQLGSTGDPLDQVLLSYLASRYKKRSVSQ